MWTIYVSVVAILPVVARADYNFVYNNGWIPVSTDTVYNQFKRERTQVPSYIATHKIQVINTDISKVLSPQNKLDIQDGISDDTDKNTYTFELECVDEFNNCQNEVIKNNNSPRLEFDFMPNGFYHTSKENTTVKETVRRSKKIADNDFINEVEPHINKYKPPTESFYKTYEVTEDSDSESEFESEESETKDTGYTYEPTKKHNWTIGLFEILSKYNINKDDELPNYALSRQNKAQTPLKQNLPVKPFYNQDLYKYNNLNHLPVDPLLAVFLSNYGFYLRGMYGIQNHYNNLYGYLASNNIHNNRPFGLYKVFSDTDSSH